MNTSGRIVKNTLVITAGDLLGTFLSFIFIASLARYLGTSSYGIYAFASAFVILFQVFFDLGLSTLVIREIARHRSETGFYFGNSLGIKLVISLAAIAAISIIVALLGYDLPTRIVVFLISIICALEMTGALVFSTFNAYEYREYEAGVKIFGKILYVTLGFLGIYLGLGLVQIVVLILVSTLTKFITGLLLLKLRVARPEIRWEFSRWRELVTLALPFALGGLFLDLYFNIDMTMLSLMKGDDAVAWYSVAYRFINLFMIVPASFTGSIWPYLSRLHTESRDRLPATYRMSIRYLLMLAVPITLGMILLADLVILIFFGEQYSNSVLPLRILMVVIILVFLTYLSGSTLGAINKPELTAVSLLACIFINIGLNLYLIPLFSYIGAAAATVATELALYLLYSYYLARSGIRAPVLRLLSRPLFAGLIMALVLVLLRSLLVSFPIWVQLVILIPCGVIAYLLGLLLIRALNDEDFLFFRRILGIDQSQD
jgi:O-antigen/teichoic acid export membrane protein